MLSIMILNCSIIINAINICCHSYYFCTKIIVDVDVDMD